MVEEGIKDQSKGQAHDRVNNLNLKANSLEDTSPKDVEITLGQKMLSAVSGSVFTSLLGISCASSIITRSLTRNSHTSRCSPRTPPVTATQQSSSK